MIENITEDPEAKFRDDSVDDRITLYELEFHRADNPPEGNMLVLCTDGKEIGIGYYRSEASEFPWRRRAHNSWPEVKAWAELPEPNECMADCYPDRACGVCGCTQNNGCAEGCSWIEWDLCSKCAEGQDKK
jgi:hypothetical protein